MKEFVLKIEEFMEIGGTKKDIVLLVLGGLSLAASFLNGRLYSYNLPFDVAWVAIILCGTPIIIESIVGLITEFDIKADVLVSLALIASVCIGEFFAAGEVAFIMQLGSLLEDLTVARARAGIEKLVSLTPRTARIITEEGERIVPAEEVDVGDILRVLPGETIPVDGVITSGQTSVNQAVMTGESLPVDKEVGDEVLSGTTNQFGAFEMRASRVGADSSLQRMIGLVESADAGKAKIVGIADRWATWIVVIALTAAVFTWIFTGEIIRAVTILVVFCPCALVLATPTAIMAAIGNATKHGFLVREGDALERLAGVNKITIDKTGTLTLGKPQVTAVRTVSDYSEEEIYRLTATVEKMSEHPLGKAIVACFGQPVDEVSDFSMVPGEGIIAKAHGRRVAVGNEKLMKRVGADISGINEIKDYPDEGSTVVYVAIDGKFAGYVALSDTLREDSPVMIEKVKSLNITPVLLTGDNPNAAGSIAGKVGITNFKSGCLPEDKLGIIADMQTAGDEVCMIGDGINDAPALKKANVGIAMGGVGSDIAIDVADIALVDDEIKELPHLLELSKKMMRTIKVNMSFSMALNFLAITLAITGLLGPVVGALVHNAGSVAVIINSALLLKWKKRDLAVI
ncbi:MAG: cation-translocating P-type ATPase [Lachnospiraceae bacterium]|nr:cation-translocating P-type ATPase [Lachnospiraceae bacterium]